MSPAPYLCLVLRIVRYDDSAVVGVVTDDGVGISSIVEAVSAAAITAAVAAMAGYASLSS